MTDKHDDYISDYSDTSRMMQIEILSTKQLSELKRKADMADELAEALEDALNHLEDGEQARAILKRYRDEQA